MVEEWLMPPAALSLAEKAVHIWRVDLNPPEEVVARGAALLAADERTRAERFRFARHRRRFTVARAALRIILGRYLDVRAEQLAFVYGPQGKPELAAPFNDSGLRFNLSHSNELALYAVTRERAIGVDLEFMGRDVDMEQLAAYAFSPRENAAFSQVPAELRREAFFACWTRKEAYIKAIGEGMARPLHDFDVSLRPGDAPCLLYVKDMPDEVARWSFYHLVPVGDYLGAVVVEGRILDLGFWIGSVTHRA
ncbi:MAG: 4'-phosphopantetheinyl transferase family protein, partial [Ardenticatenaceae bacterium]